MKYFPTIAIATLIAIIFIATIVWEIKKRKNGKGSCSCGCSGCGMSEICHGTDNQ